MTRFLFADWDDPDGPALAGEGGLTWVKLAKSTDDYDFLLSSRSRSWSLAHEGGVVTSDDLSTAEKVIVRRWRSSPPLAPATSSAVDDSVKEFVERQWEAALMTALQIAFMSRPNVWSRSPVHQDLKVVSMQLIRDLVSVPDFEVARVPRHGNVSLVAKSIHVDQSFDSGRVSTLSVAEEDISIQQPFPMVFQEHIRVAQEWRLGYCFGSVGIARQIFPPEGAVDHRFVSPTARTSVTCEKTAEEARQVAKVLGLEVFTADILIDASGQPFWCDINPDGLFLAADAPDGPLRRSLINGVR